MWFFVHSPKSLFSPRPSCEDDAAKAVAAVEEKVKQVRARTVLALFSVALLWCSSLSAADALVGAVLPMPHRPGSVAQILNDTYIHVRQAEEAGPNIRGRKPGASVYTRKCLYLSLFK